MPDIQRLRAEHAPGLLAFEWRNRAYFAASIPDRGDDYFAGFDARHSELLAEQADGLHHFHLLVGDGGEVLGRVNLVGVSDGSAELGYRIAEKAAGQGLATSGVRQVCALAAEEYGLATLRASTTLDNAASRAVLARTGFTPTDEIVLDGRPGLLYERSLGDLLTRADTPARHVARTGKVADLVTYPVKGCAGVPATKARLTPAGLAHDRTFLIVDGDGTFRSQRSDPRLALIRPEFAEDVDSLTLRAPGLDDLSIPVDREGPQKDVTMFRTSFLGVDQGDLVAGWLSDALGAESRLVCVPPEHDRVTDGATPGTSAFADSSPVHVLSLSSLADLNRRLAAAGGPPLPMNRFRPNIVVDGWDEPYQEDMAERLTTGDAELAFAKLATRCAVTTVDQSTGTRSGPEPLRTLAGYRRVPEGGVAFGAMFSVQSTGELAVGDEIACAGVHSRS